MDTDSSTNITKNPLDKKKYNNKKKWRLLRENKKVAAAIHFLGGRGFNNNFKKWGALLTDSRRGAKREQKKSGRIAEGERKGRRRGAEGGKVSRWRASF